MVPCQIVQQVVWGFLRDQYYLLWRHVDNLRRRVYLVGCQSNMQRRRHPNRLMYEVLQPFCHDLPRTGKNCLQHLWEHALHRFWRHSIYVRPVVLQHRLGHDSPAPEHLIFSECVFYRDKNTENKLEDDVYPHYNGGIDGVVHDSILCSYHKQTRHLYKTGDSAIGEKCLQLCPSRG